MNPDQEPPSNKVPAVEVAPDRPNAPKNNTLISAAIAVVVLAFVTSNAYALSRAGQKKTERTNDAASQAQSAAIASSPESPAKTVSWKQTGDGYAPQGVPPACPVPMISRLPADITKATSILYPGQFRGESYKPHGGFRFNNSANADISVVAPFDGTVVRAAVTYAEGLPDVQYGFDIMNSCGMMLRIGHLSTLSPAMAAVVKDLPAPIKNDSRDYPVTSEPNVKAGDLLATEVGTPSDKNTFFDFGVIDWNTPNAISADPAWLAENRHNNPLAKHGTCWMNLLSPADKASVLALPPTDPNNPSDYCE